MESGEFRGAWEDLYKSQSRPWRGSVNLSWTPIGSGTEVLDAGCGNGKSSSTLIDMGCRVTGVDFSPSAVESCRSRFGGRAVFEVADLRALPFSDGSFDAVLAVHSIEHIPAETEYLALSEFKRVLRPGGLLAMRLFASGDFRSGGASEDVRNGILYRYHDEDSIRAALSGWEVVSVEKVDEPTRFGEVRKRLHVLARTPSF